MILSIPKILKAMIDALGPASGWHFSIVCGGPNPAHPNGEVRTLSYNHGLSQNGLTFREMYQDVYSAHQVAFTKYLRNSFGQWPIVFGC